MTASERTDLLIRNATLGEDVVDIVIEHGTIVAIGPGTADGRRGPEYEADGGLATAPFAEAHSHPDKAFSRERIAELGLPRSGDRPLLMQRQRDLKHAFTLDDVAGRAGRFLREAATYGVGIVAGQADIDSITGLTSVHGLLRARAEHADLIDCAVTAFPQEGLVADARARDLVVQAMSEGADRVGGWPNNERSPEDELEHLRIVFALAERFEAPIDINVDYFTDPTERLLEPLAELTIAHGMQGLVNANHVGALETYADDDAARVIEKVAEAGITVTVCPSNLSGTYPYRGVSRPNELLDAGVTVAIGTGNHQDNWEHLGPLDPLDRARFAWHALPLAHRASQGVDEAWRMIGDSAWRAVGRTAPHLAVGAPADLVVLGAPSRLHALRNEPGNRAVIRGGRIVSQTTVSTVVHQPMPEAG